MNHWLSQAGFYSSKTKTKELGNDRANKSVIVSKTDMTSFIWAFSGANKTELYRVEITPYLHNMNMIQNTLKKESEIWPGTGHWYLGVSFSCGGAAGTLWCGPVTSGYSGTSETWHPVSAAETDRNTHTQTDETHSQSGTSLQRLVKGIVCPKIWISIRNLSAFTEPHVTQKEKSILYMAQIKQKSTKYPKKVT